MRTRIRSHFNSFIGRKAIILCNGPSLSDMEFEQLDDFTVFGLNKINLISGNFIERLDFIVCTNVNIINQNKEFLSTTNANLFLSHFAIREGIKLRKNISLLHMSDIPSFTEDISFSVFEGHTVTYVALQIALYMGFKYVGLVGCDHRYPYGGDPNELISLYEKDTGHFCEDYFQKGQKFNAPDLKASELYYDRARVAYEKSGRTIYNLTPSSNLDVFPKLHLDEFKKIGEN